MQSRITFDIELKPASLAILHNCTVDFFKAQEVIIG